MSACVRGGLVLSGLLTIAVAQHAPPAPALPRVPPVPRVHDGHAVPPVPSVPPVPEVAVAPEAGAWVVPFEAFEPSWPTGMTPPPQGDEDAVGDLRRAVERLRRATLTPAERHKAARELRRLADVLGDHRAEQTDPRAEAKDMDRVLAELQIEAGEQGLAHAHLLEVAKALGSSPVAAAEVHEHLLELAQVAQERAHAEGAKLRSVLQGHLDERVAQAAEQALARARADAEDADPKAHATARRALERAAAAARLAQAVEMEAPEAPDAPDAPEAPDAPAEPFAPHRSTDDLRGMIEELRAEMQSVRDLLQEIRARREVDPRPRARADRRK